MKYFKFLFVLSCIALCASSVSARDLFSSLSAQQIYVLDMDSGQVLYSKNGEQQMPTSSMSKVMSMYLVFDTINKGELSLSDTLKVSEKAWRKGGSKMFIEVGDRVKVEDLIKGVIVQSGNDATIALAEGIAGSEDAFAMMLNQKASEIGMEKSHFMNASGWPNPEHYSTAQDLAILAKHIVKDFPQYYKYYSIPEFEYNNIKQRNRNPLLFRDDLNVDGIKTGHTEIGGYGLMASGTSNDGQRRVVLVMNGMESERARAQEAARVIGWALNGFENDVLVKANQAVTDIPVIYGKQDSAKAILPEDMIVTLPRDKGEDAKVVVTTATPLKAPIEAGQKIGEVSVVIDDEVVTSRDLLAEKSVKKSGVLSRIIQTISYKLFGV